jgi:transposase
MYSTILGIDISKKTFDVALLANNKLKTKKFDNTAKGFVDLKQWLLSKSISTANVCMEATGGYELQLATYLYNNNFKVSVVNPARVKGFAMSKLSRVKTDKADCELIAYFCQAMKPNLWQPTANHISELQALVNRLNSLIANKNQESNRLDKSHEIISANVKAHTEFLDKQIKELEILISRHIKEHKDLNDKNNLLESIPGIGEKTIAVILAFLSTDSFNAAKQISAFVGLNPKPRQSGSSVRGTSRISKTGDADLRKALYMPAITAIRFNPIIRDFAKRLSGSGKSNMVVVIASMRKLLHIIYGVLKNKVPFNSNFIQNNI